MYHRQQCNNNKQARLKLRLNHNSSNKTAAQINPHHLALVVYQTLTKKRLTILRLHPNRSCFIILKSYIYIFLGSVNHASIAAYRRTNSHFTSRTETEYFIAQRTDRPKCWRIIITALVFFRIFQTIHLNFFFFFDLIILN